MANTKLLTPKFLAALFRRGKEEYLPLSYLTDEAQKVLAEGEVEKISNMLSELEGRGLVESKDDKFKLLGEIS